MAAVPQKTAWNIQAAHTGKPSLARPRQAEAGQTYKGVAIAEHEGISYDEVKDAGQGEVHEVLSQDIGSVLGPGQTRLHHGESGLHEEHQVGRQKHPHRVQVVYLGGFGRLFRPGGQGGY